jgi:hypothetical protein
MKKLFLLCILVSFQFINGATLNDLVDDVTEINISKLKDDLQNVLLTPEEKKYLLNHANESVKELRNIAQNKDVFEKQSQKNQIENIALLAVFLANCTDVAGLFFILHDVKNFDGSACSFLVRMAYCALTFTIMAETEKYSERLAKESNDCQKALNASRELATLKLKSAFLIKEHIEKFLTNNDIKECQAKQEHA